MCCNSHWRSCPAADDHLGATLAFGLPLVEGAREEAVLLWQVGF